MRKIKLTQGKYALVDNTDYEWLNQWKWHVIPKGRGYVARRIKPGGKGIILMHRLIMGLNFGDGKEVDHINGNSLNNKRNNLRICTRKQNAQNVSPRKYTKSKYKGVTWNKRYKKWIAKIQCSFDSEAEAARAYNKMAKNIFGDFAKLNNVARNIKTV